jgi:glutaconate CoA-transferase subunit B
MLTELGLFSFDRERRRFRLDSVHPGRSVEEIRDNTGFEFDCPDRVPITPHPEPKTLSAIRGAIRSDIAETYPRFAAKLTAA